jgi:hypothetical protein
MTKFERRVFTYSNLIISIIGVLYLIYKYFFIIETEYGQRPHSLTSDFLHLHIITVPLLVLLVGHMYGKHIYPKLKSQKTKRKKSGVFIMILFVVMTLSGYILQVSVESLSLTGIFHSVISVLWLFSSVWHYRARL